jgi:hypothetical protein
MIKSALVAMTILGCNCEQNTCEYVRTAGIPSTSISECQSRMKAEIERTNAEYPLLVAVCEDIPNQQPAATATAQAQAVNASATPAAPAHRSILVRTREGYSAVMTTARDGLGNVAEFATIPASWVRRQISAVQDLRW